MREASPSAPSFQRVLVLLGGFVLVIACLYWAQRIFMPLALALLLTFILSPLMMWLQRRGLPRGLAVTMVVVLAAGLFGGAAWVLTAETRSFLHELPNRQKDIEAKIRQLQRADTGPLTDLAAMYRSISEQIFANNNNVQEENPPQRVTVVNERPGYLSVAGSVLGALVEVALDGAFMVILVVFMLFYREDLRNRFLRAVGHGRLGMTTQLLDEAAARISKFLLTQLVINAVFGIVWTAALLVVPRGAGQGYGIPYALLWGLLAFALRFVPYVGTWLALVFPVVLSLATSPVEAPLFQPIVVTCIYVAIEMVTGNVIEPLLFGHNTGVSPVALLIAAVFWAWLWGPVGLLLATPLTVCLLVLGKFVPQLEIFDIFLGTDPPLDTEISYYQRLLARDEDEATELVESYLQSHPPESVYDDVLLPALVLTRRDEDRGDIRAEVGAFVREATERVVADVLETQSAAIPPETNGKHAEPVDRPTARGLAIVRGEADELLMQMFGQLIEADGRPLTRTAAKGSAAELAAQIRRESPDYVCLASLPPGELVRTRWLVRRLHAEFPTLKLIIIRPGDNENMQQKTDRLTKAGATLVATTLLQAREGVRHIAETGEVEPPKAERPPSEPQATPTEREQRALYGASRK
jgi:predicted PurR-regulated permease PerM